MREGAIHILINVLHNVYFTGILNNNGIMLEYLEIMIS